MTSGQRPRVSEIIVVEGLHDKQAVLSAVDADVWVLGGDRVSHRVIAELTRAAKARGLIILTDPDGPGERIRRRLANTIPGCHHVFIPKASARAHGRIGVEHASPDAIRAALRDVKSQGSLHCADAKESSLKTSEGGCTPFTMADLHDAGLVGDSHSAALRERVGNVLGIGYANAKAFVWKLNALGIRREEWESALQEAIGGQSHT